jgi:hypothetical protein
VTAENLARGRFLFSLGLFKKTALADNLAVTATGGFDSAATLNFMEAWLTSLSYTFQLYFDFSGYTDMALGVALMLGIALPANFLSPYKAVSLRDFWRRWHITLSTFLRDYLYIPLGGNRKGEARTYGNLLVTFLSAASGTGPPGPSSSGAFFTGWAWWSSGYGKEREFACIVPWPGSSPSTSSTSPGCSSGPGSGAMP